MHDFAGRGYGDLKKELVEITKEALAADQAELQRDQGKQMSLKPILRNGAEKANTIAEKTMKRVKDNFGLGILVIQYITLYEFYVKISGQIDNNIQCGII